MSDATQNGKDQRTDRPSVMERLRSLFGMSGPSLRDEIEEALEVSSAEGDITPQERAMLKSVLNLHELRVSDVMVPRSDIVAVSLADDLAHVLSVFRMAGHSRIPVYAETLDDPRGMIHIRDFLGFVAGGGAAHQTSEDQDVKPFAGLDWSSELSTTDMMRPVLFVPPSMPALDLLIKMQAARTHMALVIDEYGGTDGLASIEDIVEMIVGDIEDEHDRIEGPLIVQLDAACFLVDARASLDDLAEVARVDVSDLPAAESVDTIGGLITMLAGRVPAKGEIVRVQALSEFEIIEADTRRIKKLMLRLVTGGPSERANDKDDGRSNHRQTEPPPVAL